MWLDPFRMIHTIKSDGGGGGGRSLLQPLIGMGWGERGHLPASTGGLCVHMYISVPYCKVKILNQI